MTNKLSQEELRSRLELLEDIVNTESHVIKCRKILDMLPEEASTELVTVLKYYNSASEIHREKAHQLHILVIKFTVMSTKHKPTVKYALRQLHRKSLAARMKQMARAERRLERAGKAVKREIDEIVRVIYTYAIPQLKAMIEEATA